LSNQIFLIIINLLCALISFQTVSNQRRFRVKTKTKKLQQKQAIQGLLKW